MTYIHPDDPVIQAFAKQLSQSGNELRTVCGELLAWFDHHVIYSRRNAPFFPLQRSDLDVLSMKSGTCGDYASLIVSVLTAMGFEAGYAYVRRDCYGDAQDHFCAAVLDGDAHILVDATQPYRKWHGFDCPHREYDLLSPAAFEARIKAEEQYWSDYAQRLNHPVLAGFLYAPWLHMERVEETDDILEQIFFLISCSDPSAQRSMRITIRTAGTAGSCRLWLKSTETAFVFCSLCVNRMTYGIWPNGVHRMRKRRSPPILLQKRWIR